MACLALVPVDEITRISYDVVLETEARTVSMRMVINVRDENHVAIRCRKAPSGTLFSYWATPGRNVLMFPRAATAFEGPAVEAFRLFPDGPELTRAQWLALLDGRPPAEPAGYVFSEVADGWRMVRARDERIVLRWRERRRRQVALYREEIFEPVFPAHYEIASLGDMVLSWRADALD